MKIREIIKNKDFYALPISENSCFTYPAVPSLALWEIKNILLIVKSLFIRNLLANVEQPFLYFYP
ncbi:hypothetical protein HMPREF9073_01503 [Capnocytophaga sp. oral taxon 326 str. F0382]|nr:hypothetical protein HMPREF9073_01503 [Capnocytophaga sp. oral taxon 326 str. F0382]